MNQKFILLIAMLCTYHHMDSMDSNSPTHRKNSSSDISHQVRSLLEQNTTNVGAVNTTDNHGRTLLHQAAETNKLDIQALINYLYPKVNAQDEDGFTPLHWAIKWINYPAVKALVYSGAQINTKNKWKTTPLHDAVHSNNRDIVHFLLAQENIQVNKKDRRGRSPLDLAILNNNKELIQMLLAAGAKVSHNIGNKSSPQLAMRKPIPEDIKTLLLDWTHFITKFKAPWLTLATVMNNRCGVHSPMNVLSQSIIKEICFYTIPTSYTSKYHLFNQYLIRHHTLPQQPKKNWQSHSINSH